jgi:hypothetical protein
MKVFNLRCGQQHAYEGWFASEADFVSQQERGIIACPLCGDTEASAAERAAPERLAPRRAAEAAKARATR